MVENQKLLEIDTFDNGNLESERRLKSLDRQLNTRRVSLKSTKLTKIK